MIVAISHAADDHATAVLDALRALGEHAVLLDLADFPAHGRIAIGHGAAPGERALAGPSGRIPLDDVTAVWWRRPRSPVAEPGLDPADAAFAVRQTWAALCGAAGVLDAAWVNDPWRDLAAGDKSRQLAAAERAGLRVPRTLVTNDSARAEAFLDEAAGAPVVHKAVHATPEDWRTTRLVRSRDRERLAAIRLAPVILQEYVPGVDVRVTAVGDRLFAAAVDARDTSSPEDFRPVFDEARVEPCALPSDVALRLRALMANLGLAYGAIDLRRTEGGEHVFLEVNPSGQWLFAERRTGLPITAAVAALLAHR